MYRAEWEDEYYPPVRDVIVHEEDKWIDTKLYDSYGRKLYRTDKVPLGIIRSRKEKR